MATNATSPPPPPPQWVLDLNSTPSAKPKTSKLPDPPGFEALSSGKKPSKSIPQPPARKPPSTEETDTLKLKKAWELALAPAKQVPMNAIGMYMTGNSLQIYSVFMVFMLFKGPLTALLALNQTFARFETPGTASRMLGVKLAYVACNCLLLALGIWKVRAMGLLPTTRSDWLGWEGERGALERAYPGVGVGT